MTPIETLERAHLSSSLHRHEIENSSVCGCFYCLELFETFSVAEWTDGNETALCPNCGIDAVIGDRSGFGVADKVFLADMHKYWFNRVVKIRDSKPS